MSNQHNSGAIQDRVRSLRLQILNGVLWTLVLTSGLTLCMVFPHLLQAHYYGRAACYSALYAFIVVAAFAESLGYVVRALVFPVGLMLLGFMLLVLFGAGSNAMMMLFGAVLFAGMFFGRRGGLIFLAIIFVGCVICGALKLTGYLHVHSTVELSSTALMWIVQMMLLVFLAATSILAHTTLFNGLAAIADEAQSSFRTLRLEAEARQKAEEEVRASRNLLNHVLQSASDVSIIATDSEGLITVFNRGAELLLGYKADEVVGKRSILEMHSEAEMAGRAEELRAQYGYFVGNLRALVMTAEKEGADRREWSYIRKNLSQVPVSLVVTPMRSSGGTVQGYLGIGFDIKEQKLIEIALRESEQRFRTLAENITAAIFIHDGKRYRYVNRALETISGFTRDELLRKEFWSFIHPDFQNQVRQHSQARLLGEETDRRYEVKGITKGGHEIWIDLMADRIEFEGMICILGTFSDITDRKRAEEALRKSEEQHRFLFERNPAPMLVYQRQSLRMLGVNEAFERNYGYTRKEALALHLTDLYPEDEKEGIRALAHSLRGHCNAGEWHHVRRDGTKMTIVAFSHDIVYDGHDARIAVVTDLTERKTAEQAVLNEKQFSEALIDSLPGIFYVYGPDLRLRKWNRNHEVDTGFSAEELRGRHITEWHASETDKVAAMRFAQRALQENFSGQIQIDLLHKDRRQIPYLMTIVGLDTSDGRVAMGVGIDISQRVEIERALRESELFLKETQRIARVWGWKAELQESVVEFSPGLYDIVGIPREKTVSVEEGLAHVAPEYADYVRNAALQCFHSGTSFSTEAEILTKNGGRLWMEIRGFAAGIHGKDRYVLGMLQDITARKQEEHANLEHLSRARRQQEILYELAMSEAAAHGDMKAAARLANEQIAKLVDVERAAVWLLDEQRTLVRCIDLYEHSKDEHSDEDVFPLSQFPIYFQAIASSGFLECSDVMADPRTQELAASYFPSHGIRATLDCPIRRSGAVSGLLTLEHVGEPRKWQQSEISFASALAEQLASVLANKDRRQAEEEAKQLRKYLSNIIDSMPSVLVGVDKHGNVTQWNTTAEHVTGLMVSEAQGKPLDQVLPSLHGQQERIQHAMRAREVQVNTKVPRLQDGEIHYDDITVYPLVSNGVEGAVIRVDDVTDRVRIEEIMVQSEKMLSVGGLAAGMAHEINNPLAVILQASQNILRRITLDLPSNVRAAMECGVPLPGVHEYLRRREILTFLEDIRNSGQRAADIVTNMLSFSRKADEGGAPVRLDDLLDRTLALAENDYDLKKNYDFRRIEIERVYSAEPPLVHGQSSKIQQVFLNILRNGAQAMQGIKTLGRMPRFVLRIAPEDDMIRVEIQDNGPGMDEATRKRVFEPFFTTKPPGVGTGLGMSVSYFIITEDHHGTLSVESTPGAGTRFVIRLPREANA